MSCMCATKQQNTSKKVFIFDLDCTLWNDNFKLYPQTYDVLNLIKGRAKMYVASHNLLGEKILEEKGLLKYFEDCSCFCVFKNGMYSKFENIRHLIIKHNINPSDIVFFDDVMQNCRECSINGILSIKVNPYTGIDINTVEHYLNEK